MLTALLILVAATQSAKGIDDLPRNTSRCTYTGVDGLVKPFFQTNADWDSETVPELPDVDSNRTSWQRLISGELKQDQVPTQAVQSNTRRRRGFIDRDPCCAGESCHRPWHTALQPLWHDFHMISKVLQYEVVHTPTLQKPYFEGIVVPMPNICCRAKTLEQLQDRLLKQYSQYLATLKPYTTPTPVREGRPLDGASIAQPLSTFPKIHLQFELETDEALLTRRQKIYLSQFGGDVNFPISNVK